jgi:phosphatidylglycerophosphate synthase
VLAHLLDVATPLAAEPIVIHARPEEHRRLRDMVMAWPSGQVVFAPGPPSEGATILHTDRLYDRARLNRAVRSGRPPDEAAIWRLDRHAALASAEAELIRRQTYQPLGRYWALKAARVLARALCPTAVHPNALTVAAAALVLGGSAVVAFAPITTLSCAATAAVLALALVLDTTDGHLARLQGTATGFGQWMDALFDEMCDMSLHAAVAWAAFVRQGTPLWLVAGMVYGMGKYLFVVSSERWSTTSATAAGIEAPPRLLPHESALRAWVALLGHADVRWHVWIVLAALGRLELALAGYALYFPARTLGGLIRKGKAALDG